MTPITGTTLIAMGYEQGPHFGKALKLLNESNEVVDKTVIKRVMAQLKPAPNQSNPTS